MSDLVKVVSFTNAGEGSSRNDATSATTKRTTVSKPGKETSRQTSPALTTTKESTPGKVTSATTEVSPDRVTRQTQQPVVNLKVQGESITTQMQEEQRTERQAMEDEGFMITFKMRISDFLGCEVA